MSKEFICPYLKEGKAHLIEKDLAVFRKGILNFLKTDVSNGYYASSIAKQFCVREADVTPILKDMEKERYITSYVDTGDLSPKYRVLFERAI